MSETENVKIDKFDAFVDNIEQTGWFKIFNVKTALSLLGLTIVMTGGYFLCAVANTPINAGSNADYIHSLYLFCIMNFMLSGAVLMACWHFKSNGE